MLSIGSIDEIHSEYPHLQKLFSRCSIWLEKMVKEGLKIDLKIRVKLLIDQ